MNMRLTGDRADNKISHACRIVEIKTRDRNIERCIAHQCKIGWVVLRKRLFTRYALAKDLDLVHRTLLEPLGDHDLNIPCQPRKLIRVGSCSIFRMSATLPGPERMTVSAPAC